jgi:uncharacterized protein YcbX
MPQKSIEPVASALPSVDVLVGLLCVLIALLLFVKRQTGKPRVAALHVYPIKSCAETTTNKATVTARGFEGDRMMQCTSEGFVCTPRDTDKCRLFHVVPRFTPDGMLTLDAPGLETLRIDLGSAPTTQLSCGINSETDQRVFSVRHALRAQYAEKHLLDDFGDAVADWMQRATGIPAVRLTGAPRSFSRTTVLNPAQDEPFPTKAAVPVNLSDEAPYHLTSVESLADLNRRLRARGKAPVEMRRFRPNIVISGLRPWEEDSIKKVRIGGVLFWAWQRCGRCRMTTVDRETLAYGPEPLATLSTFRERAHGQRNFGIHLIPVEDIPEGAQMSTGASVEIVEYDQARREEWQRLFG